MFDAWLDAVSGWLATVAPCSLAWEREGKGSGRETITFGCLSATARPALAHASHHIQTRGGG